MLKLLGIGALGNMLSPAAMHLNIEQRPAKFIRIHDRNPANSQKQDRRNDWITHGAKIVNTLQELIASDDFDGIVICAGKNGDDLPILSQVIHLIDQQFPLDSRPFIMHLSTLSIEMVEAAYLACKKQKINYVNYPLTGGVKGAKAGTMLILASGDQEFFNKIHPFLEKLGQPKYYGPDITAAAKVKLIGHLMVFNGLLGISSAVALQKKSIELIDQTSTDFFDFLNQGAGGTKQWDVALRQAINDDNWHSGFLLTHALVDAIYAADLLMKFNLPAFLVLPILQLATLFNYILQNSKEIFATQIILKSILSSPEALEECLSKYQHYNPKIFLEKIMDSLPTTLKEKVRLDVTVEDFQKKFLFF